MFPWLLASARKLGGGKAPGPTDNSRGRQASRKTKSFRESQIRTLHSIRNSAQPTHTELRDEAVFVATKQIIDACRRYHLRPPSPPVEEAKTPKIVSIKVFPPQQPLAGILRPPGLKKPPRHTHFQFLEWKPPLANFTPPRLTRPPRIYLAPGDVRVWCYTSPPVEPSESAALAYPTNTTGADRARIQCDPWATTSSSEAEPPILPGDDKWGPIKVTLTAPHISYRERRL
ncbi:hypothetical protein PUN28_008202 [Cardiocondyla obscurior]|uniref:Uncharacterized protein n=1 Tax=Cardiocondyla obscurior TaxID=286306 RepID=A0AAW2G2L5_9HYME